MKKTITVRLDARLRDQLRLKASLLGKSDSEFVREILEREVQDKPLGSRVGHLAGSLSLGKPEEESWRKQIRARNWRS